MAKASGNQLAYAAVGGGVILVWAGLINRSVFELMRYLVSGKQPPQGPINAPWSPDVISGQASPVTPGPHGPTEVITDLQLAYLGRDWAGWHGNTLIVGVAIALAETGGKPTPTVLGDVGLEDAKWGP